jgi:hypothetical protein
MSERIRSTGDAMRETRRAELREEWRERADDLDKYARRMRASGDPREAEDAEAAAMDYRIAADELGEHVGDELQRRADAIYAADRAQDVNEGRTA